MRALVLVATLAAAGCGTTKQQKTTDPVAANQAEHMAREQFRAQPPPSPPPVDVSRSTESGPSGGAGVGPRAN